MLSFKIIKIDIFQSYFFGDVEFRNDSYKINIQNQKKRKNTQITIWNYSKKSSVHYKKTREVSN